MSPRLVYYPQPAINSYYINYDYIKLVSTTCNKSKTKDTVCVYSTLNMLPVEII